MDRFAAINARTSLIARTIAAPKQDATTINAATPASTGKPIPVRTVAADHPPMLGNGPHCAHIRTAAAESTNPVHSETDSDKAVSSRTAALGRSCRANQSAHDANKPAIRNGERPTQIISLVAVSDVGLPVPTPAGQ
jgi:hypothetical protein